MRSYKVALIALSLLGSASLARIASAAPADQALWLKTPSGALRAHAYASATLSAHPRLVVVLHGDLDHPGYHYRFAKMAAAALPDTVAVGLLRPGYVDAEGDKSDGVRGAMTADNYTPEVLASLGAAIADLKSRYAARDVTLVGHSGGSALSADLLELRPDLAKRALLVSCPCDLGPFRRHMLFKQMNPVWLLPTHSLSPMDRTGALAGDQIAMVVGGADDVAPIQLTERFATAASQAHAKVSVQILPGRPHDILLEPAVLDALRRFQDEAATAETAKASAK